MATQDSRGIITRRMISSESKAGQCFIKLDRAETRIDVTSQAVVHLFSQFVPEILL